MTDDPTSGSDPTPDASETTPDPTGPDRPTTDPAPDGTPAAPSDPDGPTPERSAPRVGLIAAVAVLAVLIVGAAILVVRRGADPATTSSATSGVGASTPGTKPKAAARPIRSPGCAKTPAPDPARSTTTEEVIRSSGVRRMYHQYVPARYDGTPAAVVIELHGYNSGAAGQEVMSRMAALADTAGFVLVTPQGNGPLPYWNSVPHADLPDDVQFVADIIDRTSKQLCTDPDRVYVDGISNGGMLTSLVGCRLADKVAAIAPVAGLTFPQGCSPARPLPVLAIHGTEDKFLTFDGHLGPGLDPIEFNADSTKAFTDLPLAPIRDSAQRWAAADGCTGTAQETPVSATVTQVHADSCPDGASVQLYVIEGGGHTWPGSQFSKAGAAVLGPTTFDIDANQIIWAFFQAHPMPR